MQKALIVALVFTIVLSSFAVLGSGGAHGAASEAGTVNVQNLTFDTSEDLKNIFVDGDSQNISLHIENSALNISVTGTLSNDTFVEFHNFETGASNWEIKYKCDLDGDRFLVNSVSIWAGNRVEYYDSEGNHNFTWIVTQPGWADLHINITKTGYTTVYNSVENKSWEGYDYGSKFTDHDEIIRHVFPYQAPFTVVFHAGHNSTHYIKIDYISEKVNENAILTADNIAINRWDDGDKGFYQYGFSEFKKRGMFGSAYIITSQVSNREDRVTWGDIKNMSDAGWEIGDHTEHHYVLTSLSFNEAKAELYNAKSDLEQHGYSVFSWAPPSGATNRSICEYARGIGLQEFTPISGHYYADGNMRFFSAIQNIDVHYLALEGHVVSLKHTDGDIFITQQNLTHVLDILTEKKLFVISYKQAYSIAMNNAYATAKLTTDDNKKIINIDDGMYEWAEVKIKGDYTHYYKITANGKSLWHFYKDGYTYILVPLQSSTRAGYSATVTIEKDYVTETTNISIDAGAGLMLAVIPLVMFAMFFNFFGEAMQELGDKMKSIRK